MPARQLPSEATAFRIDDLAARVAARLSRASASPTEIRTSAPVLSYSAYEASAAVLAWFDPARLNPIGDARSGEERDLEIDRLLTSSIRITDASGTRRWTLRPERRVRILRELRSLDLIASAIEANERPDDDIVQRALNRGLRGEPAQLSEQTLVELKASLEVALWLHAAGFQVSPSPTELQSRIEWRTLLAPFEHVAGAHFRGREDELRRLRSFVGVVPPRSIFESASQLATSIVEGAARKFLGRPPKFAFVISGPGGVGKSTLIAHFILQHAEAHERDRFPFAYIDFDRPDVSPEEPLTILAESIRQLGVEYPEVRENCERLRLAWLEQLAAAESEDSPRSEAMSRIRTRAIRDAAAGLSRLTAGDRPIVLVLDTFEEVQFVGSHEVNEIWKFLEALQSAVLPLRIVIAGRGEIKTKRVEALLLSGFDEASALGYLEAKGVHDVELARSIFRRLGGSPLTLKLAAELWVSEGDPSDVGVVTRDRLFRRLTEENIQRQLYKRVLNHIHEPKVEKLAHPGLILRRITPELILEVLADPCDVPVRSLEDARALFEDLKREVSLVKLEADGALRHRQDLRLLMLGPLREDEPEKTQMIHRAAVQFYLQRTTDAERAEEIYHRLWLDQPLAEIEGRWRRGVGPALRSAIQEFDPRRRAFLAAKLQIAIDDEARKAARLEDWERIVTLDASGRLEDGDTLGAMSLIAERPSRTIGSPLILVEANALVSDGRIDEAQAVLDTGFKRASSDASCKATVSFALKYAENVIRFRRSDEARIAVERLMAARVSRSTGPERSQSLAQRLFLAELDPSLKSLAPTEEELLAQLEKLSIQLLTRSPTAAQWIAAAPGENPGPRVERVVSAIGIPLASDTAKRTFAGALTVFDVAYSAAAEREAGAFARRCDVPMLDTLTASWSKFVVEASSSRLTEVAAAALALSEGTTKSTLVESIQQLMEEVLGLIHPVDSSIASQNAETVTTSFVRLSEWDLRELVSAIAKTFNADSLVEIVLSRLGRHVYAYAATTGPFEQTVLELVRAAEQEGWLQSLLIALIEARPDDYLFARLASKLGISGLTGDAAVDDFLKQLILNKSLEVDLDVWRNRLGQIERSVCRVNMAGRSVGTGVLVGPDVVLTAGFTVGWPGDKKRHGEDLEFLFDYRTDASGQALTRGSVFGLSRQGIVALENAGNGDFALLRVDGSPGAQPIGGTTAESAAQLRRWIELPQVVAPPSKGTPLAIAHHPRAGPLQINFGQVEAIHPISYSLDTAPGSSGALCFDARSLEPVALHMGRDPATQISWGLELGAVLKALENRKLDHWVHARFV